MIRSSHRAGLDGEVRGTKVALRECSPGARGLARGSFIGVPQPLPLAGGPAWLQAIPGPNQFRLRSTLYVIALQRWLSGGSACRSTWRRRPTCDGGRDAG